MTDPDDSAALAQHVDDWLRARIDPAAAGPMNTYMKIEAREDSHPLLGVPKSVRKPLNSEIKKRFTPTTDAAYRAHIEALWALPHREGRYVAAELATFWKKRINLEALPLYERLIRESRWWDLVDIVACKLTALLHLEHREIVEPIMGLWIDDDDLWVRRTALLSHMKHKLDTNEDMLFHDCLARAHEKAFFVRKAIGWALREYSYSAPDAVQGFLETYREQLSGLSYREGAKRLRREGLMT